MLRLIIVVVLAISTFNVWAKGTTTVTESNDVTDSAVTNAKLKAMRGSESPLSIKMRMKYLGAGVDNLGSGARPNPDNNVVPPETELQGTVAFSYRLNSHSTVSAGTGISFLQPEEEGFNRSETYEPYIQYDRTHKTWGMEHDTYGKIGYYTGRSREAGRDLHFVVGDYFVKPLEGTRFSVGVDFGIGAKTFTKYNGDDYDWGWGLSPFAEYKISDSFNATLMITTGGSHYRRGELLSDTIFAEFGLGYSLTDVVYINPVVAMYPESPDLETTTISIDTIVSAF